MTNKPNPKPSEMAERMAELTMYLIFACVAIITLALVASLAMLIMRM